MAKMKKSEPRIVAWLLEHSAKAMWTPLLDGVPRGQTRIRTGHSDQQEAGDIAVTIDHENRFIEVDCWEAIVVIPVANNRIRVYSRQSSKFPQ